MKSSKAVKVTDGEKTWTLKAPPLTSTWQRGHVVRSHVSARGDQVQTQQGSEMIHVWFLLKLPGLLAYR